MPTAKELFIVANEQLESGNLELAVATCDKLLAETTHHWPTLRLRGMINQKLNRFDRAVVDFAAVAVQNPADALSYTMLGDSLFHKGDYQDAATSYRRSINIDPRQAESHNNLSAALCLLGDNTGAIGAANQALKLQPNNAKAFCNLGNAYIRAKAPYKAETAYRNALQINPQDPQLWCNLGSVLREQNRLEPAIEAFETALTHRPELPVASMAIANIKAWQRDHKKL